MCTRVRIVYFGRVQGVGFRATAAQVARTFDVTGYVRNQPDGTVELVAEGDADELDRFVAAVAEAMRRNIRRADRQAESATGEFRAFDVRRS
jgi:acylphosphatase